MMVFQVLVVDGSGFRWSRKANASVFNFEVFLRVFFFCGVLVYWCSDSWSEVTGDESILGVGIAH